MKESGGNKNRAPLLTRGIAYVTIALITRAPLTKRTKRLEATMGKGNAFEIWGRAVHSRHRLVLVIASIGVLFALAWGTGVFHDLQTAGGFGAPSSQSQREGDLATNTFGRDAGDVVVLYSSPVQRVGSPPFERAVTGTLNRLPRHDVESTATYWSTGSARFVSADGHETYAVVELKGNSDTARQASYDAIKSDLAAPGLHSEVGGAVPTDETINNQTTKDIGRAESLSFPILLLLLLIIFGSLTAAGLPLVIGAIGILGSFTVLRVLTLFTSVSIFSANITTILGLGLAIDYGLFMVSRFREELQRQDSVEDAVAQTVATAGRTVLFSGVTVAIALASLMLFPETFLRSMGYGGVLTVLVDMAAALTVLPALLSVLGPKVNSLRIRPAVRKTPGPVASGSWYRLAHRVMKKPAIYSAVIVVVLLAVGSPFLRVAWGGTDATVLPSTAAPRIVTAALTSAVPRQSNRSDRGACSFRRSRCGIDEPRVRPVGLCQPAGTTSAASPARTSPASWARRRGWTWATRLDRIHPWLSPSSGA